MKSGVMSLCDGFFSLFEKLFKIRDKTIPNNEPTANAAKIKTVITDTPLFLSDCILRSKDQNFARFFDRSEPLFFFGVKKEFSGEKTLKSLSLCV